MQNPFFKRSLALAVSAALALSGASLAWADDDDDDDDDDHAAIAFAEAHIFFELNNTDGDLGIHALIDGEGWKRLKIEDSNERKLLDVKVKSALRRQGLTEFFFESAEPTFDELGPVDFFARFPEGTYEIEGRTLDGVEMESEVEISHAMPGPPNTQVNGEPEGTVCDEDDPDNDAPEVDGTVEISWDEVTMSHPDADGGGAGVQPPVPIEINNYEVVVELELDDFEAKHTVILPPGVTSAQVPGDFMAQAESGQQIKYEVLARADSFNQTATESCFVFE